ncbi:hypothetical protein ACM55K_15970 [Flavobacterium sp. LT1R49]|uniref:hypothetical protein n=1 Tax=Flavobacterium arabinosi TaxID=3398737 RepID=UPI003A8416E4
MIHFLLGGCSRCLKDRYGDDYCVVADRSLLMHAGNDSVPYQMILRSTKGNNSLTPLLFNTTLFTMKSPLLDLELIEIIKGPRIF